MFHMVRIGLAFALTLALSVCVSASPVLPGGGTLSGTIAILSEGSIEYTDNLSIVSAT